jgi:hypothetical protein
MHDQENSVLVLKEEMKKERGTTSQGYYIYMLIVTVIRTYSRILFMTYTYNWSMTYMILSMTTMSKLSHTQEQIRQ